MPEIPHEYVVRKPENEEAYVALFDLIVERGVHEMWRGRKYQTLQNVDLLDSKFAHLGTKRTSLVQHVSPSLPTAPVLRVTQGQRVISGFPQGLPSYFS